MGFRLSDLSTDDVTTDTMRVIANVQAGLKKALNGSKGDWFSLSEAYRELAFALGAGHASYRDIMNSATEARACSVGSMMERIDALKNEITHMELSDPHNPVLSDLKKQIAEDSKKYLRFSNYGARNKEENLTHEQKIYYARLMLQAGPDNYASLIMGNSYLQLGQTNKAIASLSKITEPDQNDRYAYGVIDFVWARALLLDIHYEAGDIHGALSCMAHTICIHPDFAFLHVRPGNEGVDHAIRGSRENLLDLLDEKIRNEPENPTHYFVKGLCQCVKYSENGLDGIANLKRAIELSTPDDPAYSIYEMGYGLHVADCGKEADAEAFLSNKVEKLSSTQSYEAYAYMSTLAILFHRQARHAFNVDDVGLGLSKAFASADLRRKSVERLAENGQTYFEPSIAA